MKLFPHPIKIKVINMNFEDCTDCKGKGYTVHFDEGHDIYINERCWSCEDRSNDIRELVKNISKMIAGIPRERLAMLLSLNIVSNALDTDSHVAFLQQYVASKEKESILQYASLTKVN